MFCKGYCIIYIYIYLHTDIHYLVTDLFFIWDLQRYFYFSGVWLKSAELIYLIQDKSIPICIRVYIASIHVSYKWNHICIMYILYTCVCIYPVNIFVYVYRYNGRAMLLTPDPYLQVFNIQSKLKPMCYMIVWPVGIILQFFFHKSLTK